MPPAEPREHEAHVQMFGPEEEQLRGDVDSKFGICSETYKSRTVISIGYMASRFKSKLCMVLSHSPQPFNQQAPTVVSSYFESRVLNNPR